MKHNRCAVYKGNCLCGENYVGESVRDVILRWTEHEDPNKQSETAKHFKYFLEHHCEWKVLTRALEHMRKRKILEAFLIKSTSPTLNE